MQGDPWLPVGRLLLSEARERVAFDIGLPTRGPDGFTMSSSVRISYIETKYTPVEIIW